MMKWLLTLTLVVLVLGCGASSGGVVSADFQQEDDISQYQDIDNQGELNPGQVFVCKDNSDCEKIQDHYWSYDLDSSITCRYALCQSDKTCDFSTLLSVGAACNDANNCTLEDACNYAGECVGFNVVCPSDGLDCTKDACDPDTGECYEPDTGAKCEDDDPCTIFDYCDENANCVGGQLDPCDDGKACTKDFCEIGFGCMHSAVEDGQECGLNDQCISDAVCQAGECVGKELDCFDNDSCTADLCDPDIGCVYEPIKFGPCDDGDPCSLGDYCDEWANCVYQEYDDCNDGIPCTFDYCDVEDGCVHVEMEDGTDCDDGDPCNEKDTCNNGECYGIPLTYKQVVQNGESDCDPWGCPYGFDFEECFNIAPSETDPNTCAVVLNKGATCYNIQYAQNSQNLNIEYLPDINATEYSFENRVGVGMCWKSVGEAGCFIQMPRCTENNQVECVTDTLKDPFSNDWDYEYLDFINEYNCLVSASGVEEVWLACSTVTCEGDESCNDNHCTSYNSPINSDCIHSDPCVQWEYCNGQGECVITAQDKQNCGYE